jgi:tetratricopeptide (TPR) repeat protein
MNRRTIVLVAVLAVVAGAGGYKYYEHVQFQRAVQAQVVAMLAEHKAAAERKKAALEEQQKLVAEAKQWLDRGNYQAAGGILQKVLSANSSNVAARIEMARYYMLSGYINYRNYEPGATENALDQLRFALNAEPNSVRALVLLGFVHQRRGSPLQAIGALERAEKVGGDTDPFLYLNWANALIDLNRLADAEARLKRAEALLAATPVARAQIGLHNAYTELYTAMGRLDEADKHYQAHLALVPRSPTAHGNYSTFLLFERGLPDAAIAEADTALQIADYGMGRLALATARYAKWAELKQKDPKRAAALFAAASADVRDPSRIMPQAASYAGSSPAMQKMVVELVALGVPLDAKDEHGDTGLTLAAYMGKQRSVEVLAKMGASIDSRDEAGRTAFILAAGRGHVEVAKALQARGARIDAQDVVGKPALHHAVSIEHEAMVRALLAMKVSVNLTSNTGQTALMLAAAGGNQAIARLLLDAGADRSVTLVDKRTAADLADAGGHKELAGLLRTGGKPQ